MNEKPAALRWAPRDVARSAGPCGAATGAATGACGREGGEGGALVVRNG